MAIKITDTQHYSDIAAAIRTKTGSEAAMTPAQMAAAIETIPEGGELDALCTKKIAQYTTTKREVTTIPSHMFQTCTQLEHISASYVTTVSDSAFNNIFGSTLAPRTVTISLPKLLNANQAAFRQNSFAEGDELIVNAPLLQNAQNYAFYGSPIKAANFPAMVTLGNYAFQNCRLLESAVLDEATAIPFGFFQNCAELSSVSIPNVTSLLSDAFSRCTALATLELPKCTSIGATVFSGCSALATLILRSETVATLQHVSAFTGTPIASGTGFVYVPDSLVETYKSATNWSTYASQIKGLSELPA